MSAHVDVAQIMDLKSSAKASDLCYLNGNDRLDRGFDFSLLLMDVFWLNNMDRFDNTCLVILCVVLYEIWFMSLSVAEDVYFYLLMLVCMSCHVDVAQIVDLKSSARLRIFRVE
nr:hypothetical protein Iba_chr02fCG10180 [Ipomoea batatas]